jgi:Flp pilus assembly protein TadD
VRPPEPDAPKKMPPEKPAEKPAPKKQPADMPKDEHGRLVAAAREAFAAGEYGRAERRFAQAIRAEPKEPLAYFLMAQAQFALGKYQEAVASIEDGLRLKPDWPGERFDPSQPYAGNKNDYTEHLERLEETLQRHPNDFFLLFLRGYQLWFDGDKVEARALFEKALKVAPEKDKPFVNRFLLHGMPIARAGR